MKLTEEQIIRWLDDELSAAEKSEVEAIASADPELRAWKASDSELKATLQDRFAAEEELPFPELFHHQLGNRIEAEQARKGSWKRWFAKGHPLTMVGLPWAVATASLLLLAVFVFSDQHREKLMPVPNFASATTYSPDPEVSAETYFSPAANATVIVLDGWEPLEEEEIAVSRRPYGSEESARAIRGFDRDELAILSAPY